MAPFLFSAASTQHPARGMPVLTNASPKKSKDITMPAGGKRQGAGRPKGAVNKKTAEVKARLSDLARQHTDAALLALVEVCRDGTDAARVAAANSLLDRGYGKPIQGMDHTSSDGSMKPSVVEFIGVESPNRTSNADGEEL